MFAFAITLLILAIRIPRPTDPDAQLGLLNLLVQDWRSYLAFFLSFMLVGINWANHRVMLATLTHANHAFVWLNLLYLMLGVAFIPVPTAILGAWLGSPNNHAVAAVFYGGAVTVAALLFSLIWWYAAYVANLTSPTLSPRQRRADTIAWGVAPLLAGALTGLAFVNPELAVAGYLATIILYVLPLPGLLARAQRRRRSL